MRTRRRWMISLALLLAALLLLPLALPARAPSPNFELQDLDGHWHRLSDYRGRWVVVNYWATWCPPCLEEMPELSDFYERYRSQGVVVLGVNLEEIEPADLERFLATLMVDYPVLLAGVLPPEGMPGVRGLPTTLVVTPAGEIVATRLGGVTGALLEEIIRAAGGELDAKGGQRSAGQLTGAGT